MGVQFSLAATVLFTALIDDPEASITSASVTETVTGLRAGCERRAAANAGLNGDTDGDWAVSGCALFEATTIVVDSEMGDEIPPEEEDMDGTAFMFLAIMMLCCLGAGCMCIYRKFARSKMAHPSGSQSGFVQHHHGQSIVGQPYPVSNYGGGRVPADGGLVTLSPVPVAMASAVGIPAGARMAVAVPVPNGPPTAA